jgi:Cytochrome bd terminal oxidase subunit I
MDLDPALLSRVQFAWVIAWHILLPAFTVGLASFIAVLEGLRLATGRKVYVRISTFWIKIFSIAFGMGVVTGIVMPFQFGTNWSRFSDATANVLSPLFAYEGLTAFFLEAGFLGVLLFGRKLVPPWALFRFGPAGRAGDFVLVLLDPGRQRLDADAGWVRDRQWAILRKGLARGDLHPLFSVPFGARRFRFLRHHRLRRARGRRLSRPA